MKMQFAVIGLGSLVEIDLRKRMAITIMAIKQKEDIIVAPAADQVINSGDILVAVGKNEDLMKLSKL